MKFDFELQAVLERQTVVEIHHVGQQVAPFGQLHPRLPLGVAWSFQRVMAVASACPHLNASPSQSLPCGQTDVSFFRALRLVGLVFRYQPAQRTVKTAVRLFWWQLYWSLVLRFAHNAQKYFYKW